MKATGEGDSRCAHRTFVANVEVSRLEDVGRFTADVRIECCDLNGAAVSVDGTEARLAIAPRGEVITPLDGGLHGFTVRREDHSQQ